jgi:integrase
MALTVKGVAKLIREGVPGRHTDGVGGVRGLMLCVEGKTSAHWLLRYQRGKKVRHMGLGSARDLSLAAARQKASHQRERIAQDIDPLELKRKERDAQREADAKRLTFRQAAERYHGAHAAGWTSAMYADEFLASLERWAYPHIGNLDVAAIDKDAVLKVLEQQLRTGGGSFWIKRAITADRVRNRIERVLDFAAVRGFRSGDNPARWRGYLEEALQAPRKVAPVKHLHALPYAEVPQLIANMDASVSAQALRFVILTAARVGEALGAKWEEIDLEAAEWVIPASRMKSRREHRVPLSPRTLELLRSLYREQDNPFVFIGTRPGTAVTQATVLQALRRLVPDVTVHGFRSAFSTWAHERTAFSNHVIELSLAHSVGTQVERSYRRTDLAEQRRKLLEAWATYLSKPAPAGATVTPLRKAHADA